jgi:zinc protease
MGHPAIPRAHPDFDALLVANYVLGGAGLSSRIAETVRTRNGLAYAAGSFLVPRRLAGPFAAVAQTRSETCVRAIELVRAEIERVRSEPLPEEDLDTARRQFAGSLPFRLETVGHKAGALLEAALYDLGPRHLERQIERVSALAPEEVRAAARAHLAPEQATIVVVGERAALFERLRALGEVMEVPPP